VLRGAFDGHVLKRFGNGVLREYHLHFNMAIGVTPVIHADNQATMGERFLKFEMHDEDSDDKVRRALGNLAEEIQMQEELSDVCRRFLLRKVEPEKLPAIPNWAIEQIVALAQLVAILRAQVEREAFGDRDVKYRPVAEIGTRVAKQLAKLGQMLTYVYEVPEIDEDIMRVLRRVAFDTTVGFHLDIVRAILWGGNAGMNRNEIAKAARIPEMTASRRLDDLVQLQVLERKQPDKKKQPGRPGPSAAVRRVTERVAGLWRRAAAAADPGPRRLGPRRPPASVLRPSGGPRAALTQKERL